MAILVRRREFVSAIGGAAWSLAARGQTPDRIRRIGVLSAFAEDDPEARGNIAVFRQALEKLGWTDGGNARIDYRWGGADDARILLHAQELLGLKPDVFLVSTGLVLQPLQQLTRDIPIIFTQIIDPVSSGFVASLAHPGGNITGFTPAEFSMYGKALQVLKEAAPHLSCVAVMLNPEQKPQLGMWRAVEAAAPTFRVQLTKVEVRNADEIERAIDRFAGEPNCGLIVLPTATRSTPTLRALRALRRTQTRTGHTALATNHPLNNYGEHGAWSPASAGLFLFWGYRPEASHENFGRR
jgi:putative tryptophan/tyrosine transport system substrate-binding protein